MDKQARIFLFLAPIIILAFSIFTYRLYIKSMSGELGNKEDYSILQAVESQHRNDTDQRSLMIITNINQTGRDIAGFPIEDNHGARVWITLNKTGGDGTIYAMPDHQKNKISCRDLDTISSKNQGSSKILNELYLICLK